MPNADQRAFVNDFFYRQRVERRKYRGGNFKLQYAKQLDFEPIRKKLAGHISIRLTPALIYWCTVVGRNDYVAQKKLLAKHFDCNPNESVRFYAGRWIPHRLLMEFMMLGFSEDQRWKLAPVMRWWLKSKQRESEVSQTHYYPGFAIRRPEQFIDTLNTSNFPMGLQKAFDNWSKDK